MALFFHGVSPFDFLKFLRHNKDVLWYGKSVGMAIRFPVSNARAYSFFVASAVIAALLVPDVGPDGDGAGDGVNAVL
jgi:hypothetical protein